MATCDGPARGVRCAASICDLMRPFGIAVRSGLHTGEIELKRDDVAGIAVHIAARVAAEAKAGETVVSSTVRDLVAGSGLRFEDRGLHSLRGPPEQVHLYTVLGGTWLTRKCWGRGETGRPSACPRHRAFPQASDDDRFWARCGHAGIPAIGSAVEREHAAPAAWSDGLLMTVVV
jgi:hypothetical protein